MIVRVMNKVGPQTHAVRLIINNRVFNARRRILLLISCWQEMFLT